MTKCHIDEEVRTPSLITMANLQEHSISWAYRKHLRALDRTNNRLGSLRSIDHEGVGWFF